MHMPDMEFVIKTAHAMNELALNVLGDMRGLRLEIS